VRNRRNLEQSQTEGNDDLAEAMNGFDFIKVLIALSTIAVLVIGIIAAASALG